MVGGQGSGQARLIPTQTRPAEWAGVVKQFYSVLQGRHDFLVMPFPVSSFGTLCVNIFLKKSVSYSCTVNEKRKAGGLQLTSDLSFTIIGERKVTQLLWEVLMANDTKERILTAALEMFSQNGYAGTNIRELSASLGLVKSGVYKHYESKEAIWNALLDEMIVYYGEHFGSAEHLPPVPDSLEALTQLTMHMVNITIHDEKIVMTRKMLAIEQFRDDRARELATRHFLTGLTDMFTHVFTGMMEKGLIHQDDPKMLAFAYTAPISALIHLCDREPEKTEGAIAQIEAFSRHFIAAYGVK
jgi:AcrR family transcriptional regulator